MFSHEILHFDRWRTFVNWSITMLKKKISQQPFKSSSHAAVKAQYSLISSCSIFLVLNIITKCINFLGKYLPLYFWATSGLRPPRQNYIRDSSLPRDTFASQITIHRTNLFTSHRLQKSKVKQNKKGNCKGRVVETAGRETQYKYLILQVLSTLENE